MSESPPTRIAAHLTKSTHIEYHQEVRRLPQILFDAAALFFTVQFTGFLLLAILRWKLVLHRRPSLPEVSFPGFRASAGGTTWTISPWLLSGIAAILPLSWLAGWTKRRRATHRHSQGRCPTCGYDLRATPHRCPECGAKVR